MGRLTKLAVEARHEGGALKSEALLRLQPLPTVNEIAEQDTKFFEVLRRRKARFDGILGGVERKHAEDVLQRTAARLGP